MYCKISGLGVKTRIIADTIDFKIKLIDYHIRPNQTILPIYFYFKLIWYIDTNIQYIK